MAVSSQQANTKTTTFWPEMGNIIPNLRDKSVLAPLRAGCQIKSFLWCKSRSHTSVTSQVEGVQGHLRTGLTLAESNELCMSFAGDHLWDASADSNIQMSNLDPCWDILVIDIHTLYTIGHSNLGCYYILLYVVQSSAQSLQGQTVAACPSAETTPYPRSDTEGQSTTVPGRAREKSTCYKYDNKI